MSGPTDKQSLRRAQIPDVIAYPEDLPITQWRPELLETIRGNQVVIVAGETGSGKSTQLPKLCLELGRGITLEGPQIAIEASCEELLFGRHVDAVEAGMAHRR